MLYMSLRSYTQHIGNGPLTPRQDIHRVRVHRVRATMPQPSQQRISPIPRASVVVAPTSPGYCSRRRTRPQPLRRAGFLAPAY